MTGHMLEGDFDPGNLAVKLPGLNEIQRFTHPIYLTGGIVGTGFDRERAWGSSVTYDFTTHDDVLFDPSAASYATPATVTCQDGTTRTGGLEFNFLGTGNYLANGGAGTFTATFEVVGSSGALDGTTGSGKMSGEPGVPGGNGEFSGTLHLR